MHKVDLSPKNQYNLGEQSASGENSSVPPLVPIVVSWIIGLVVAHHWLVPLGIQPLSSSYSAPCPWLRWPCGGTIAPSV